MNLNRSDATPWADQVLDGLQETYPVDVPFAVLLSDLVYAAQLSLAVEPKGLLVQFWGSPGPNNPPPMLANPDVGRSFSRHTLTISDPSLFLDSDLTTGVFLGAEANDPIEPAIALIKSVAASLSVAPDDIVLVGTSSGGFAAVMAACRMGARAIALNPQLNLPAIRKAPSASVLLNRYRPGIDPDQIADEAPLRCFASSAFLNARANGLHPQLAIFQNTEDVHHFRKHLSGFCSDIGVYPRYGDRANTQVLVQTMSYVEGHSTPHGLRTVAILDALHHFYPDSRQEAKAAVTYADVRKRWGFDRRWGMETPSEDSRP